jgi:SulP family sulfate permease
VLTVVFDLVVAIGAGLVLASLFFMKRMADVTEAHAWVEYDDEDTDPDNILRKKIPPHTRVYEINGPMFFATAGKILQISPKEDTKALVLRMRSVSTIDATALRNLELLLNDCNIRGVTLIMSHVNEQPMKAIQKAGFDKKAGAENFCAHIDDALSRAKEIVNAKA